ncbi:MAG: hypothetical protein A2413_05695 [Treponema sp. RIFOXYC1_FULL_61_9]|nr:MAG: hypothetical protein A2413_05695 [Treponema sp. RIFOXYC1_FULL_61_9]
MDDYLMTLSDKEFRDVARLMYERFGIHLTEQKRTLVAGRLTKRIRNLGLANIGEYLVRVHADKTGAELTELVDRITTNHSFFYREKDHFEFLVSDVLTAIKARRERDAGFSLRVWSAGCATGEEPYTIAMAIREFLGATANTADWGVLATDLSLAALREAIKAVYADNRVRELPAAWRSSYLEKRGEDEWAIKEDLRRAVMFKRLNLMNENYPFKGLFDVVFCRNVMIYFDPPVRRALVDRIYRYVKPGGYLFVGHSESLPRETCPFDYVRPAIYRKADVR